MKRSSAYVLAALLAFQMAGAQTLEDGKKKFYYERYSSARDIFNNLLAANPNNTEATYWLGQCLIQLKDTAAAAELYSKSLQQNGNAPLILAGMGHVELMMGKAADARQRFDVALTLTKGKDVSIYNAVGMANVYTKGGDAVYAIEKLNAATQLKDFKNADTYIILGDAFRKQIDGGNAVTSFTKALAIDTSLASARYRIGKVYLTQNNREYFLPAFEQAVDMDANYAPALYELYYYYYFRDITKAAAYFDQFISVTDANPSIEYDRISIIYARKRYAEAIAAAQQKLTAEGNQADARYYKLIAYCYDESNDSLNARSWLEQYFAHQQPANFVPKDYFFLGKVLAKFGQYADANKNYELAISADTSLEGKLDFMKEASELARRSGNRNEQANWLGRLYSTKLNPGNRDLYDWGFAHYQARNYLQSDSIFCSAYQSKYPNEIIGYLWCARSKQAMDDSVNSQGLAVESYKILADKAREIDITRYKSQAISAYFFLVQYYNDVANDRPTAIGYCDKVLEVDSTNADALRIKELLIKASTKPPPAGQPKKPASTGKPGAAILRPPLKGISSDYLLFAKKKEC